MKDLTGFDSPLIPPRPLSDDLSARDRVDCGHLVQFYSKDEYLLDTLEVFVGGALVEGASVIMIATAEHQQQLAGRLRSIRVRLSDATKQGRYFALDAKQTLTSLMMKGKIDRKIARHILGSVVEKAFSSSTKRNKQVVVFGEMVALLWAEEKRKEAMQLENFWNDMGRALPFSLLCGYPITGFEHVGEMGLFLQICAAHSAIIPEPTIDLKVSISRGTIEGDIAPCPQPNDSGGLSAQWLRDYEAALSEIDTMRLFNRIEVAEAAILGRLELLKPSEESNPERQLLLNAAANLQIIKRKKLGFE